MEPEQVLATARSGQMPAFWHAWPLRRDFVLRSALRWSIEAVIALVVLVVVVIITVPYNFQQGQGSVIFTLVLLLIVSTAAFGGLGIAIYDLWRVRHAGDYLLVMTPDDFVKAEPRKVTHVPMEHIAHVTLRGVRPPDPGEPPPDARAGLTRLRGFDPGLRAVQANSRRMKAQNPSLAFLDMRTNKEVVVATDSSFDELPALEYVLQLELEEHGRRSRRRA